MSYVILFVINYTCDDPILALLWRRFPSDDEALGGIRLDGHVHGRVGWDVGEGGSRDLGRVGALSVGVEGRDPEGVLRELAKVREVVLKLRCREGFDACTVGLKERKILVFTEFREKSFSYI